MTNIKYWEEKIKEKRKKTQFKDFLKEIVSWSSIVFYKNNGIISKFPESIRTNKIISHQEFDKNVDILTQKGLEYDFSMDFFSNYKNLLGKIELFNLISHGGNENSNFSDAVISSKNIYLSSTVINDCENVMYSFSVKDNSSNVLNSVSVYQNSDIVYYGKAVVESFKIFYSSFINNSSNIWFSSNLTGCNECIFCNDIQNCSYYINNKEYEKQVYYIEKEKILKNKQNYSKFHGNVDKIGKNYNSSDVIGSGFFNSQNVENGYFGYNVKDGKNLMFVGGINGNENMYDTFTGGGGTGNNFYGVMGANGENLYSCMNIATSYNLYYCYFLNNCSFCFGCIGLKNKSYCILNKQYTKEEWVIKVNQIFEQMDKDGILGDFFPAKLNPYYFNDTTAGLFGIFTKKEAEKEGFMWRDDVIKVDIPEGAEVIEIKDLNNYQGFDSTGNWEINPDIIDKMIKDEKGNLYKIVQMEYNFLVKHGLPIPNLHWLDRIKLGLINK